MLVGDQISKKHPASVPNINNAVHLSSLFVKQDPKPDAVLLLTALLSCPLKRKKAQSLTLEFGSVNKSIS